VFVKKYNKIWWQRLAKDRLPLKAQHFTAQEKVKDFFDFFNGRTANIRKNTYNTWENREILRKNCSRT
ncbi:MAG: hypothetical protein IIW85_02215, partial [Bacteroidaceae bacterium]|nr:hypothetical protein [Bacteroidaceae bacterium]